MAREIFLHAGAHRTGTSSFQLMLAENRAVLRTAGIMPIYPGRDGAPGGTLRLRLPGPASGPRKQRWHADRVGEELRCQIGQAAPGDQILLSEENIPGRMLHFFSGRFFPAADMRLQMLAAFLRGEGIERPERLLYVVRSYAGLFESAYRKRAEDNPVGAFSEIAHAMTAMTTGWPDVVGSLQRNLRPEHLIVLPYEKRGRSTHLLAAALGREIEGVEDPSRTVNLSATDAALEALQRRYHAGETLARRDWKAVVAEHAHETAPRGFASFTAAQKAQLDARYATDCDRLAAMPGVEFLG